MKKGMKPMLKKCFALFCLLLAVCFAAEVILPAGPLSVAVAEETKEDDPSGGLTEETGEVSQELGTDSSEDKAASSVTMYNGATKQLRVSGSHGTVKWSSSDKKVATVSSKGLVKAKKVGTAVITAKYDSGEKKFNVTVKSPLSVKPSGTVTVSNGGSTTVKITYHLSSGKVGFKIADDSIASGKLSSRDGDVFKLTLTGKKAGTTKVTVTNSKTSDKVTFKLKVTGETPTDPPTGVTYRALIIGNGTGYQYLNPLSGIANDVRGMKKALASTNQNWQITAKENLTKQQMLDAIATAFSGATADDICLFFYSGHGDESKSSTAGSLCGIDYDSSSGHIEGGLTPVELRDALTAAAPGKVIVALDSCGSGSVIYQKDGEAQVKEDPKNFTQAIINAFSTATIQEVDKTGELRNKSKFAVLAACQYGKTSMGSYVTSSSLENITNPFLKGSAFTYALVTTMGCKYPSGSYTGSMSADSNGDGKLTLKETYSGTSKIVKNMDKIWRAFVKKYRDNDPYYLDWFDQVTQYFGENSMVLFSH